MRKVTKAELANAKIYDARIIIALGAALLLGAAVIMLFYNMPAVRYGLLIILAIILIWKRKVLFSMLRMIQNKHE